jgi:hypothetical protein
MGTLTSNNWKPSEASFISFLFSWRLLCVLGVLGERHSEKTQVSDVGRTLARNALSLAKGAKEPQRKRGPFFQLGRSHSIFPTFSAWGYFLRSKKRQADARGWPCNFQRSPN